MVFALTAHERFSDVAVCGLRFSQVTAHGVCLLLQRVRSLSLTPAAAVDAS